VPETCRAEAVNGKAPDMASAAPGVEIMLRPWARNFSVVCVQYFFPFLDSQNAS
jgi:hypothetical protein